MTMPEEVLEIPQTVEPKPTNWPKIILVAVLGFGLLAASAYAGYWYGTESAKVKTQSDETVSWKVYTDTDAGFEIKYPENWIEYDVAQITNNPSPLAPLSEGKLAKKGTISIQFMTYSKSVSSLDEWFDTILGERRTMGGDPSYTTYKSKAKVAVGGKYEALRIEAEDPGGRLNFTDYLIKDTLTMRGVHISISYPYNEINEQKELTKSSSPLSFLISFKF